VPVGAEEEEAGEEGNHNDIRVFLELYYVGK
jgi:hypothetical protein